MFYIGDRQIDCSKVAPLTTSLIKLVAFGVAQQDDCIVECCLALDSAAASRGGLDAIKIAGAVLTIKYSVMEAVF